MRRRFDFRRVPLLALFLVSALAIWCYLLRFDIPQIARTPSAFFVRAVFLLPVVLFFASLATLVLWYLFRMFLPGLIRYRRLRLLRERRALDSTQRHRDTEKIG